MSASQAERREFDPRLPLHFFQRLGVLQQLLSLHVTQLSSKNGFFGLFCRFGAPGQSRLGINIDRHSDAMPALVSGDFGVNPGIVARTGMGSAQHLKLAHSSPTVLN